MAFSPSEVSFHSRVTGACPATTDSILAMTKRGNISMLTGDRGLTSFRYSANTTLQPEQEQTGARGKYAYNRRPRFDPLTDRLKRDNVSTVRQITQITQITT